MNQPSPPASEPVLWLNGEFRPLSQAAISPLDRGLLYGDGLFETLRAQDGQVLWLREHLARLQASARLLKITNIPELDWPAFMVELLRRNHLDQGLARVKVVLTRGAEPVLGLPAAGHPTLMVMAQAYAPPTPQAYQAGWRLHSFSLGAASALAGHKTLSYLYYLWARQSAQDAGDDEALILDAAGLVAETAMGSLLCRQYGRWWTPKSPAQLPGITLARLCRLLAAEGQEVDQRPARVADIQGCPTVWVLGSLVGIMPASHIDGRPLAEPLPELAAKYRQRLWQEGGN